MDGQFCVTVQVDGFMDVVGPFRSEGLAERYARLRRLDDPRRAFVQARPLLRLSAETRQELAAA